MGSAALAKVHLVLEANGFTEERANAGPESFVWWSSKYGGLF